MGDLSKLKVAIAQPDLSQTDERANGRVQERMVERALDAGADVLVLPGSLIDATDIRLIALNDTRIDIAGSRVLLEAAGESFIVSLGRNDPACDFSVVMDLTPWTLGQGEHAAQPGIVLRPVGMLNEGSKVCAFAGATTVSAADGTLLCRLRDDFEEDYTTLVMGRSGSIAGFCENKLLTCLEKTVQRFDRQILPWGPTWVIGLSGGLDSSVCAALLVRALGKERVAAYNLASSHNSSVTKANAASVAAALGLDLHEGSIQGLFDATVAQMADLGFDADKIEGLVAENAQARIRGQVLSTAAALLGGVVVNNGNRVEEALGYFTMYGDSIGALAPLGDLTKVRLFDLALALNDALGTEAIPSNLIPHETVAGYTWQTMPSAELADGQRDPMKWFYHDWLIEQLLDAPSINDGICSVLEAYLSGSLEVGPVGKWLRFYGLDNPAVFLSDLDWVMSTMQRTAFKRVQAPPCIKVASLASVYSHPVVQGELQLSERYEVLRRAIARG